MSGYRLPSGGRIDRSRTLRGTFDGQHFEGHPGDTLASALLASGVDIVGRSFKLSRPRGLLGAGMDEANAIVTLGEGDGLVPNIKATEVAMADGLTARVPNAWPDAARDVSGAFARLDRFLPAGFYYKSFIWPDWHLFEPAIRKLAGMGELPEARDPQSYEHRYASYDRVIVGGGLAGLSAAKAAGEAGLSVLLVEMDNALGGQALWNGDDAVREALVAAVQGLDTVTVMTSACAFGRYDQGSLTVWQKPGALWHIRAGHIWLASGALERPVLFENNDLPGVMLLSAAERYAGKYGVAAGQRVAVAGVDIAPRAEALAALGVNVVAVLDARDTAIIRAKGRAALRAVEYERNGQRQSLDVDALLMSGGWTPNVHLLRHAEGKLSFDEAAQTFIPAAPVPDLTCIGACDGRDPVADGEAVATGTERPEQSHERGLGFAVHPEAEPRRVWVDFHNDVRLSDIRTAADEGFQSVEHLKRYTTLGMASDQGRTSNINGLHALADHLGKTAPQVGTTRFRPPFKPVTMGGFAGQNRAELLQPLRRTAFHDDAIADGAVMEDYARWSRASLFAKQGESEEAAIQREAREVRKAVGLFDASPLGKIEVWGPDAGTFLDRIYAGTMSTLKTGRVRYGLMMNEQGAIFDDGVCARLEDDLFLVGTTSGNAARVHAWMEEWHQREWPDLRIAIVPVTAQWATLSINGPRARALLERLEPEAEISAEALKHMQALETTLLGDLPARILRVSFTGELCFEVSVPAVEGAHLWCTAMDQGRDLGALPFGIESLMVMRIEKGFAHIGSETDGETLPDDLGYGRMVANKKSDCVGRRSTQRPNATKPDRRQMVGLEPLDPAQAIPLGAHVVGQGASQGWVSSAAHSPTLGRAVALAMINAGRERFGETVTLFHNGKHSAARICEPCALDPEGERLRV